jgi:hypothetical protein
MSSAWNSCSPGAAADAFLAEDVRDIVRRQWGDELLNDAMFKPGHATMTVRALKAARVDDHFWTRLRGHQNEHMTRYL